MFGHFPEVPVTKIGVSAPAPCKNPTVTHSWTADSFTKLAETLLVLEGSKEELVFSLRMVELKQHFERLS